MRKNYSVEEFQPTEVETTVDGKQTISNKGDYLRSIGYEENNYNALEDLSFYGHGGFYHCGSDGRLGTK